MANAKSLTSKTKALKSSTKGRFPEVQSLLEDAIAHKRKSVLESERETLQIGEIAEELGMPAASLWNYTRGRRIPPEPVAETMAAYFYEDAPRKARHLTDELSKWRKLAGTPTRRTAAMDRLDTATNRSEAGSGELRFISCHFPPFSGDKDCFLDRFVTRSVTSGGLKTASVQMEEKNTPNFDIRRAMEKDDVDLAVGYFATLEYAVRMHWWYTPFKICLSAVLKQSHGGQDQASVQQVQQALLADGTSSGEHPSLCAFVLRHDVGATYLQALNLSRIRTAPPVDSVGEMIEKMRNFSSNMGEIPVAVLNEFTSFQLLRRMKAEGVEGVPVMPMSSRANARDPLSPRSKLPAYRLTVACKREQTLAFFTFRDLIDQMLNLFLRTEVENTSSELADFFRDKSAVKDTFSFKKDIEEAAAFYEECRKGNEEERKSLRFKAAYSWVLYALGIDRFSLDHPDITASWQRILIRTRERMLEDFAKARNFELTTGNLIKGLVENDDEEISAEELRQVEELFDIDLKLEGIQIECARKDRGILVRAIQNVARRLPIGLPFQLDTISRKQLGGLPVEIITPQKKHLPILDGFLSDLHRFYRQHVDMDDLKAYGLEDPKHLPKERLAGFRKNLKTFGEKEFCKIILAAIGNQRAPMYIGSAFLQPYPSKENETAPTNPPTPAYTGPSLMLSYLWTHSHYRNLGIATFIVYKAIEYAKEKGFKFLVAEMFRTLNEQVAFFKKQGFEFDCENEATGRLVFRFDLSKPHLAPWLVARKFLTT